MYLKVEETHQGYLSAQIAAVAAIRAAVEYAGKLVHFGAGVVQGATPPHRSCVPGSLEPSLGRRRPPEGVEAVPPPAYAPNATCSL